LLLGCALVLAARVQASDLSAEPDTAPVSASGPKSAAPDAGSRPAASERRRPRVALVLSGGGARGFAHIGVLRVLRDLRVPVDMVVGTSMGGVVGGAYAAGAALDDLEEVALHTDWERVVADRPARADLTFRRREEDVDLPSRLELGLHRDGLSLPPAAAGNAALEQTLVRLLPADTHEQPVDQLALPFRSVASDLVTGELVELSDTPLFLTMRASLAVPGVFAPVRVNKRLVVDGGLLRNLPVDLARQMGADIVIAVNAGTPLAPEKNLGTALGVAQQMINILTEQNVQRSLKELGPRDLLIAPALDGISFLDFRSAEAAIAAGEQAARALAPMLSRLAVEPDAYARYEAARLAPFPQRDAPVRLARVDVQTDGRINPAVLQAQTGLAAGQERTREQVRRAAESLYGRADLDRIETDIEDRDGARHVELKVNEAYWANSRLRVGLELGSDFDDANRFAVKLMHVRTSINSWDGEFRTLMQIGDQRGLAMQLYQPLGAGSPWYAAPLLEFGSASLDVFTAGRRSARVAFGNYRSELALGRQLGNWGDVRYGWYRQRASVGPVIPDPVGVEKVKAYGKTHYLRYRVDTLDSLGFPSRGALVDAQVERSLSSTGDPAASAVVSTQMVGLRAFRSGNLAGHVYGEFSRSLTGAAPLRLGGFLRLSGSQPDSIGGRRIAFARVVLARTIGTLPVTLGGAVRADFSIEAGGAFDRAGDATGRPFRQAFSGFFTADTRFGPAYFGAGATRDGDRTFYLYLGPIW
jgi:NTE family protein